MKMKAINTKYGIIYNRNALILSTQDLILRPFQLTLHGSLSLASCKPKILDEPDVSITFLFTNIESLSIYKLEDYPYEKYSTSCFDEVEGNYKNNRKRIILSTYDYVFDVIGLCEII